MDINKTVALEQSQKNANSSNANQKNIIKNMLPLNSLPVQPVLAWLVCAEGADKGIDYPVTKETSGIGKGLDIPLGSGLSSLELKYDKVSNIFTLIHLNGENVTRVNGNAIDHRIELSAYDTIELDGVKLIFIPFCESGFVWE